MGVIQAETRSLDYSLWWGWPRKNFGSAIKSSLTLMSEGTVIISELW